MVKFVGPRLRELAPAARGSQDAVSRNLGPIHLTCGRNRTARKGASGPNFVLLRPLRIDSEHGTQPRGDRRVGFGAVRAMVQFDAILCSCHLRI